MNIDQARNILGIPNNANFQELKNTYRYLAKKYHPDNQDTGDSSKFTLISAAFTVLEEDYQKNHNNNTDNSTSLPEDVKIASNIKTKINEDFDDIYSQYRKYITRSGNSTRQYIKQAIYTANSDTEVEKAVQTKISNRLREFHGELEGYLDKLIKSYTLQEQAFLNLLFSDLYYARRRYWLFTLYRDPVLVICFLAILVWAVVWTQPEKADQIHDFVINMENQVFSISFDAYPLVTIVLGMWWLPIFALIFGTAYVLFKLIRLAPRKQFIPPSLSPEELTSFLKRESQEVGMTKETGAIASSVGLASLGAGIGSFLVPGLGTVIGGAAGAIIGGVFGFASGQTLLEIKDKTYEKVIIEFDFALQQLNDRIETWLEKSKDDLIKTTEETLAKNLKYVTGLFNNRKLLNYVVDKNKMLPPSSKK